jgi:hypothetical protein
MIGDLGKLSTFFFLAGGGAIFFSVSGKVNEHTLDD